ncbi:hypothetical protein [Brevundimonas sp.]|uniref:hypothetical protein n=1 Tax=Brevundimonas sp. TaxID=1871086 RepID=UPI0027F87D75|nr:hypothetical protein [Brevundimonas sp.]MDQ7812235.1 hypothetical protein [Brevundimonas sp.]
MSLIACRAALMGASLIALAACATTAASVEPAAAQAEPVQAAARESTAFTLGTDQPRAPEQLAMRFDKADLSIRVIPDEKAIDAVALWTSPPSPRSTGWWLNWTPC